jgi:protein TonB
VAVSGSASASAPQPVAVAPAAETSASRLPGQAAARLLPSVPVMLDTTWYGSRQLDVQPKARQAIEPAYPESARRDGVEGTVILVMRIDELGRIREMSVESAQPPGIFDESALRAFQAARFDPAILAGRAVRSEVRIRVNYSLDD